MVERVTRFCDYEQRSREPDAAGPRNPIEADVIVLDDERARRAFVRQVKEGMTC